MIHTHQQQRSFLASTIGLICLMSLMATFATATTTTHTITISGVVSGKQTVTTMPGGKLKTSFSYRDNGRGPDIVEEITLDAKGQFMAFDATGKSTYGAPIEETFTRNADKAKWKSKADAGEMSNVANAIYVPVESSLETAAITLRALLRAPNNKLDALPSGQLAITKLVDAVVSKGGDKKTVASIHSQALALSPTTFG